MPTKPMADAITTLSQQFFRPPHPVAPGGPALPERLPEDDTNPFMLLMDAIRGATYGAEDSTRGEVRGADECDGAGRRWADGGAERRARGEGGGGGGAEAVQGIKAYHGSAADFERFDPRRIGSGEGAASYGYGHYFAEEPQVAESYRKQLSGRAAHGSFDRYPIAAVPYIRGVVGDIAEGRLTAEQGATSHLQRECHDAELPARATGLRIVRHRANDQGPHV